MPEVEDTDILWVSLNDGKMTVGPEEARHGTLKGFALAWPLTLQPGLIEWGAAVAFMTTSPEEAYFVCDIVHAKLTQLVQEARECCTLAASQTLPKDELLSQSHDARTTLAAFAKKRRVAPTEFAMLGVSLTFTSNMDHFNHFYSLDKSEVSGPLLREAVKYDTACKLDSTAELPSQ